MGIDVKTISQSRLWGVDFPMIFVILGTQDKDFSRLLKEMDRLIDEKHITQEVVVQAGTTKKKKKNMKIFDLLPMTEFNRFIGKADLIITHGGVGSIVGSLKKGKKVIAVPRLKKYGEHTNDHQLQIVKEFSRQGYVIPCLKMSQLGDCIEKSKTFQSKPYKSNNKKMLDLILNCINDE